MTALTEAALAAFSTAAPPRQGTPSTERGRPRRGRAPASRPATGGDRGADQGDQGRDVVIDLAQYAAAADGRTILTQPTPTVPTRATKRRPRKGHEPPMTPTPSTDPRAPAAGLGATATRPTTSTAAVLTRATSHEPRGDGHARRRIGNDASTIRHTRAPAPVPGWPRSPRRGRAAAAGLGATVTRTTTLYRGSPHPSHEPRAARGRSRQETNR